MNVTKQQVCLNSIITVHTRGGRTGSSHGGGPRAQPAQEVLGEGQRLRQAHGPPRSVSYAAPSLLSKAPSAAMGCQSQGSRDQWGCRCVPGHSHPPTTHPPPQTVVPVGVSHIPTSRDSDITFSGPRCARTFCLLGNRGWSRLPVTAKHVDETLFCKTKSERPNLRLSVAINFTRLLLSTIFSPKCDVCCMYPTF